MDYKGIVSFRTEYLPLLNYSFIFCTGFAMFLNDDVDRCMKLVVSLNYENLQVIIEYDTSFWSHNCMHEDEH